MKLSDELVHFLHRQGHTVISTIDTDGSIHNSCKGIVEKDKEGKIYLLDLYKQRTYENLKNNNHITLAVVDEHKFVGYCLKGKASIVDEKTVHSDTIKAWEKKITSRISQRILKNVHGQIGHPEHPEMLLPKPEYLIMMEVEKVVDLTPHSLKS